MARFRGLDLQFPPRAQSFFKLQDVFFESLQMQHLKIPKKKLQGEKKVPRIKMATIFGYLGRFIMQKSGTGLRSMANHLVVTKSG